MTIKKQGQEKESRRKWRRKSGGKLGEEEMGGKEDAGWEVGVGGGGEGRERKNKQGRRRIRRLRKGIMGRRNEEEKRRRNGSEDDQKQC